MALVVLLRGVNVGGHRRFRPALLAQALAHLDVVSIGAAGTFLMLKNTGTSTSSLVAVHGWAATLESRAAR